MRIRSLVIVFLLLKSITGSCLSENSTISILTLEPGNELYTIFGHSAIRVSDETLQFDMIYNFGTFDFSSPFFYIDFLKGNLNYFLSIEDYNTFLRTSRMEQRKIFEQTLDLNYNEKMKIFNGLEKCYHSSERFYNYDFYYDNCATRVRDVVFNGMNNPVQYDTNLYCCKTFRQLLKPYIAINYWIDIGINLVLGKEADRIAESMDFMFLPDYIMRILQISSIVKEEIILLDASVSRPYKSDFSYLSPWIIIVFMLLLTCWAKSRKITLYVLTSTVGFIGLVLLSVSIITENSAFSNNLNIYWTIPSLLILLIRNRRANDIIKIIYLASLLLMILLWNRLPQNFSATFVPWILGLIILQLLDIQWINKRIFITE